MRTIDSEGRSPGCSGWLRDQVGNLHRRGDGERFACARSGVTHRLEVERIGYGRTRQQRVLRIELEVGHLFAIKPRLPWRECLLRWYAQGRRRKDQRIAFHSGRQGAALNAGSGDLTRHISVAVE